MTPSVLMVPTVSTPRGSIAVRVLYYNIIIHSKNTRKGHNYTAVLVGGTIDVRELFDLREGFC